MSTPEEGGGRIGFTVKELLADIKSKLDALDIKLDTKADRERVHQLANHVAAAELRILAVETQLTHGVTEQIRRELAVANRATQAAEDRTLGLREKVLIACFGFIASVGTIVSTFVLLRHS